MIRWLPSRLQVPAVMAVGGSVLAVAFLVGTGWRAGLGVAAVTVVATAGYYLLGGRDTDGGALFGSRADERQTGISLRAAALAGNALVVVALGGVVVTAALGHLAWPFVLVCLVGVAAYLSGLVLYRDR